jgi:hypothetical protein
MMVLALFGLVVIAVVAAFGIYWFINRVEVSERDESVFNHKEGDEK